MRNLTINNGLDDDGFGTRSSRLALELDSAPDVDGSGVPIDDDGKTWERSNLVDLGGHGDHSGAMEPTVAELSDGRLFLRTSRPS